MGKTKAQKVMYSHDLVGTITQQRCKKCKKFFTIPCHWMDTIRIVDYWEKITTTKDCPCPSNTQIDSKNQFLMKDFCQKS